MKERTLEEIVEYIEKEAQKRVSRLGKREVPRKSGQVDNYDKGEGNS